MIARDLLTRLGLGQYAANTIIPYLMVSPATTDPKASQIIQLVQAIQRMLYSMGATDVVLSGHLDPPTARALRLVVGDNWERMTWVANVTALTAAQKRGQRIPPPPLSGVSTQIAVEGPLDFLPDIPGGLVTYGVGAYLLYRLLSRRS